ncbi:hypothetical protein KUTeg_012720 [Tegillarca granosa]|uniref:Uncharacterized protein n=1 Tax=Tegillarca granosa TaxID=220873 RepID=A0ABQ9F3W0_TEGGR|nr:hypothetical protein KUTeg_012720 [Tegillarca granosa]
MLQLKDAYSIMVSACGGRFSHEGHKMNTATMMISTNLLDTFQSANEIRIIQLAAGDKRKKEGKIIGIWRPCFDTWVKFLRFL